MMHTMTFRIGDFVETVPEYAEAGFFPEYIKGTVIDLDEFPNIVKLLTVDGRTGWINEQWIKKVRT